MVVSIEYVFTIGASKSESCVGIFRFSCFGTIISSTPKSILKGVFVFLIRAIIDAPIHAYFFATLIGTMSLISNVTKSFPVSTSIFFLRISFNCSGVFGILRSKKST